MSLLARRNVAYERGYYNYVEVPSPIYAQALLLQLVQPTPRSIEYILLNGVEDVPENFIRCHSFDCEKRIYRVDPAHASGQRNASEATYDEKQVARFIYFLRGRVNVRTFQEAMNGKYSNMMCLMVRAYNAYVIQLSKANLGGGQWGLGFPQYMLMSPDSALKVEVNRLIAENYFSLSIDLLADMVCPSPYN